MLEADVREILRELGERLSARSIEIIWSSSPPQEGQARALGNGRFLVVSADEHADDELERAARALRAAARRWGQSAVPTATWPEATEPPTRERVRERIDGYLGALAASSRAKNAIVTLHGEAVAWAQPPTELESERVAFTLKRVEADAASRTGTSFGEVDGDDFYARSFWVGAGLILFFGGPWAIDFVRHRARHVCRELSHLLAALEPPPEAPASIAPIPE